MHHAAWVLAPLVLAGVLGFSAVTKWGEGPQLRKIVRNLRLPEALLPTWLARAIPSLEIALAVGLVTPWLPVYAVAAAATLVLMVVYWLLIARGLTLSPRPVCGCFGAVGDHHITGRTLLRNTLLVLAAVAAVALAVSGLTAWSSVLAEGTGAWLWVALAGCVCAVTALIVGGVTTPAPAPAPAPAAALPPTPTTLDDSADEDDYVRARTPRGILLDLDGTPHTLTQLTRERAQLLILVSCYCVSTKQMMAARDGWQRRLEQLDVRIVFSVPIDEGIVGTPPEGTMIDHGALVWEAFGTDYSPSAVLLGVDGLLAGGPVKGEDEVTAFVDDIEAELRAATVTDDR